MGINREEDAESAERLGKYQQTFKRATEALHGGERSIPEKTGLLESWTLLHVLGEEITLQELREMKGQIATRNLLMIEHRNERGNERDYRRFKRYTEEIIREHLPKIEEHLQQTTHPIPTRPHQPAQHSQNR